MDSYKNDNALDVSDYFKHFRINYSTETASNLWFNYSIKQQENQVINLISKANDCI